MRGWIGNASAYLQPFSMAFHSFLDRARTGWAYQPALTILFQSFWGGFAWNQVILPSNYFFPLKLLSIVALIGGGIGTVRLLRAGSGSESWQRRAWILLVVVWLAGLATTIFRIHPLFLTRNLVWPIARYAGVIIVPTACLLCFGLAEIVPRRWKRWAAFAGLLGMVLLDTLAILTVIVPFYYG
jgi:hypothetical protein